MVHMSKPLPHRLHQYARRGRWSARTSRWSTRLGLAQKSGVLMLLGPTKGEATGEPGRTTPLLGIPGRVKIKEGSTHRIRQ